MVQYGLARLAKTRTGGRAQFYADQAAVHVSRRAASSQAPPAYTPPVRPRIAKTRKIPRSFRVVCSACRRKHTSFQRGRDELKASDRRARQAGWDRVYNPPPGARARISAPYCGGRLADPVQYWVWYYQDQRADGKRPRRPA